MAGIGFAVSFQTIARVATEQHMPGWPILYPLGIDVGILALIVESRRAIDAGRSDLVPRVMAWALAALTIYVNAHGAPANDWLGRALHVVMPALWIVFLELTRWRKLAKKRADRQDSIPLARWLAEPVRTTGMRKRMVVHNITSYPVAVAREEARLLAIDVTRATLGRRWKRRAPVVLRHHLRNGTLPATLAQACEMASYGQPAIAEPAEEWVIGALGSRDRVAARVKAQKRAIDATVSVPADVPGDAPSPRQEVRQPARQGDASDIAAKRAKAGRLLAATPPPTIAEVADKTGLSRRTVSRIKATMPRHLHVAEG